jgi:hypothetical protein
VAADRELALERQAELIRGRGLIEQHAGHQRRLIDPGVGVAALGLDPQRGPWMRAQAPTLVAEKPRTIRSSGSRVGAAPAVGR